MCLLCPGNHLPSLDEATAADLGGCEYEHAGYSEHVIKLVVDRTALRHIGIVGEHCNMVHDDSLCTASVSGWGDPEKREMCRESTSDNGRASVRKPLG